MTSPITREATTGIQGEAPILGINFFINTHTTVTARDAPGNVASDSGVIKTPTTGGGSVDAATARPSASGLRALARKRSRKVIFILRFQVVCSTYFKNSTE